MLVEPPLYDSQVVHFTSVSHLAVSYSEPGNIILYHSQNYITQPILAVYPSSFHHQTIKDIQGQHSSHSLTHITRTNLFHSPSHSYLFNSQ